jgi:hypothetical protein
MSLKNPVTSPAIDPGTVRLVAQRLNHYATPGPKLNSIIWVYNTDKTLKFFEEPKFYGVPELTSALI